MKSQPRAKLFASIGAMVAILTTCVHADLTNSWDPFVENVTISPAPLLPLEFNGTGIASLMPGNNGGSDLPLGNPNGQNSNDLMVVTISLANGVPNVADPSDPVQGLTALGGPGKTNWDWTYLPSNKTFRGVQNRPIPAYTAEEVTIQYKVTANTFSNAIPFNGINVNIQPPGYTGSQPTDNDKSSSYTYVAAQDFGNAPISYGAAVHTIDLTKNGNGFYNRYMYLGRTVDAEPAYPGSSNDEDGVTFPVMMPGSTVTIPVAVTIVDGNQTFSVGFLNAWFDWNGDGVFTNIGEQVATNVPVFYYTLGGTTGTVYLQVTVPSTAKVGQTWARFRFGAGLTGTDAPYQPADFGEVEDYQVTIQSPFVTIGDFVWQDTNGNGIQDAGEPGIPNATVRLLDVNTNLLTTTTTATNGAYAFTNLLPGTYLVQFVAPGGMVFTAMNAGTNSATDSDANPATGQTAPITLLAGQTVTTCDAGLYQPATVVGYAFADQNNNLVYDSGDLAFSNLPVRLALGGTQLVSTVTGTNGEYQFTGLAPGSYTVVFGIQTNAAALAKIQPVPQSPPASTNISRTRAIVSGTNVTASVTLISGDGVLPGQGEPINIGFAPGTTAAGVMVRAYATAGGVVVEVETVVEGGAHAIVLYVFLNGQYVEVGSQPAVGEGSHLYQFNVSGLNAGSYYTLQVRDDQNKLYTFYNVLVGNFAVQAALLDSNGIWLQWESIPGRSYDIYRTDRLVGGTWQLIQSVTAVAVTNRTFIMLDPGSPTGFFKIVQQ